MCKDLFEHYILPNGDTVHLFLPKRQLSDEVEVDLVGAHSSHAGRSVLRRVLLLCGSYIPLFNVRTMNFLS